jgi:hypothetical protein
VRSLSRPRRIIGYRLSSVSSFCGSERLLSDRFGLAPLKCVLRDFSILSLEALKDPLLNSPVMIKSEFVVADFSKK